MKYPLARIALLATLLAAGPAPAEESPFSLSTRAGMSLADGTPANDMINYGLFGRYALDRERAIGVSLEVLDYDFERPWKVIGLRQDKAVEPDDIDATAGATLLTVFFERSYGGAGDRWTPYWSAGLGLASTDVKDAQGPVVGGGQFDITTDPGTEWFPTVGGGLRWNFGQSFSADFGLSASRHFADWKLRDRGVSGRTGTVDDYTRLGALLGVSYRF